MTARLLLAILALGGVLAGSRTAQADPLPLELTWDVPAGCPDDAAVVARIERILVATAPPGVTVIANGRVRATESHRFELTLTLRTGDVEETRNVEASSCSALADASAVVIALAMDPSHAHAAPEPEIAPVVPPPAPPPPRPTPRSRARTMMRYTRFSMARFPRARWRWCSSPTTTRITTRTPRAARRR